MCFHDFICIQVSVGMGMVDLEYIGDCVRAMEAGKRLSPYFVPRILPNLAAGHIAIEHGLRYLLTCCNVMVDGNTMHGKDTDQ